jgi:hypothetical protein
MPMNATQNQTEAGAATDGGRRPTVVAAPAGVVQTWVTRKGELVLLGRLMAR